MSNLILSLGALSSSARAGWMVGRRYTPGMRGFPLERRLAREFLKSVLSWEGVTMADYLGMPAGAALAMGSGALAGSGFASTWGRGFTASSSSSSSLSANNFDTFFGGAGADVAGGGTGFDYTTGAGGCTGLFSITGAGLLSMTGTGFSAISSFLGITTGFSSCFGGAEKTEGVTNFLGGSGFASG